MIVDINPAEFVRVDLTPNGVIIELEGPMLEAFQDMLECIAESYIGEHFPAAFEDSLRTTYSKFVDVGGEETDEGVNLYDTMAAILMLQLVHELHRQGVDEGGTMYGLRAARELFDPEALNGA